VNEKVDKTIPYLVKGCRTVSNELIHMVLYTEQCPDEFSVSLSHHKIENTANLNKVVVEYATSNCRCI
jgi:hypothetical protein